MSSSEFEKLLKPKPKKYNLVNKYITAEYPQLMET